MSSVTYITSKEELSHNIKTLMTTATLPTDAQLEAVIAYCWGFNLMEQQFPSFITGDRAADAVSDALANLNLPFDEDESSAHEAFVALCAERGLY